MTAEMPWWEEPMQPRPGKPTRPPLWARVYALVLHFPGLVAADYAVQVPEVSLRTMHAILQGLKHVGYLRLDDHQWRITQDDDLSPQLTALLALVKAEPNRAAKHYGERLGVRKADICLRLNCLRNKGHIHCTTVVPLTHMGRPSALWTPR